MNISSLPTDNLYKFLALFGLTIVIAALFALVQLNSQLTGALYEISKSTEEFSSQANLNKPDQNALARLEATLAFKHGIYQDTLILTYIFSGFCFIGIIIGGLLMIKGFSLWYHRCQYYQDLIIKHQAENFPKET